MRNGLSVDEFDEGAMLARARDNLKARGVDSKVLVEQLVLLHKVLVSVSADLRKHSTGELSGAMQQEVQEVEREVAPAPIPESESGSEDEEV